MSRRGKPRTPELIRRLIEIGTEVLTQSASLPADEARLLMREVAHLWCAEYGGADFYLPKDLDLVREKRDEAIWRDFTGYNTFDLAQRYGLVERQILFIVSVMRKRASSRHQIKLPGFEELEE